MTNTTTLTKTQEKHLKSYIMLILASAKNQQADYLKSLKDRNFSTFAEALQQLESWGIKYNKREAKKQTKKTKQQLFIKHSVAQHFKAKAEKTAEEVKSLIYGDIPSFKSLEIRTEWKRNHTWGYNPTSEGWINNSNYATARASGCGYDKLSATYNHFLNHNIIKKAILLETLKKPLKYWKREDWGTKNILPYCVYVDKYGVHIGANGAGVSTCCNILRFIGATVKTAGGDTWNYLEAIKEQRLTHEKDGTHNN